MSADKAREFAQADRLLTRGEADAAWAIVRKYLHDDPNDIPGLVMGGMVFEKAGNTVVAYHFFKKVTELQPNDANSWINFGRVAEDMWRTQEAERAYYKGLKIANRDESKRLLYGNLSALCIDNGRYEEGEKHALKSLAIKDTTLARSNLGFCQLAQRNWAEGWKNYRHTIGNEWRKRVQYKGEPEWDGSPGKTVVLYGEQGLGDEVSFASMVPDALRICKKLILDVDPRLKALFQRSFPDAKVYGTRNAKPSDGLKWEKADHDFDCSLALGQIGEYFRTGDERFPGTPYLVADPDRVTMWKALFAIKKKPVIGLAWSGGIPKTGAKHRRFELEQLQPLFDAVDAHWVNLQYKPEDTKGFPVNTYHYATLTKDYDDTAALAASCDLVICMQTAVAHLGGALGVPTWVFVPKASQWRYGGEGDSIPWYKSLRVIRETKWDADIKRTAEDLSAYFGKRPAKDA